MKYINKLMCGLVCLSLGLTTVSCGNDDEPNIPTVTVASGASTSVELTAGGGVVAGAVVFTATGDWKAEIYSTNSNYEVVSSKSYSQVEWLEVIPYEGNAGEISAQLYATPNTTTTTRYALVRVISATNYIDFKVAQKGTAAGGGGDTPTPPSAN